MEDKTNNLTNNQENNNKVLNDETSTIEIVDDIASTPKANPLPLENSALEVNASNKSDVISTMDADINSNDQTNNLDNNISSSQASNNKDNNVVNQNQEIKEITEPTLAQTTVLTSNKEETNNNSVVNNNEIEIKETQAIKSEVGTSVLGQINGDNVIPTNNPLPNKIDITIKPKVNPKNNVKKVKVVTKREKIISIITIIIIILGLAGGGYAFYYYGYLNNPNNFEVKNLTLEAGDSLPNGAANYVTSPITIDEMAFKVNLDSVLTSVGTYNYTVSHENVVKMGTITIKDSKGPVINFNDNLKFNKGNEITKEEIVKSCDDISNCTYDFKNSIDYNTSGKVDVTISAKDDYGNTSDTSTSIQIIDISKIITCISKPVLAEDKTYNETNEDTISFDSSNNLVSVSGIKRYTYIDYASYFTLYNDKKDDTTYTFDKKTFSYTMKNNVDLNDLKSYDEISNYYSTNDYTCK